MSKKNHYNHTDTPYKTLCFFSETGKYDTNFKYECLIENLQYYCYYDDNYKARYSDINSVERINENLRFYCYNKEAFFNIDYKTKKQVILDDANKI